MKKLLCRIYKKLFGKCKKLHHQFIGVDLGSGEDYTAYTYIKKTGDIFEVEQMFYGKFKPSGQPSRPIRD